MSDGDELAFTGFSAAGFTFLRDLAASNNREWFAAHRSEYDALLLAPAQAFVAALGIHLRTIDSVIQADTRTDGGGVLMRLYRDTRFSADKSPYKTNLSGLFWDGRGKKTERPAFGFQLSPDGLDLMAGIFAFPPPMLDAYRIAVSEERRGSALVDVLNTVHGAGPYDIGGQQLKRAPTGYPPDHPRADLLRRQGLFLTPPRIPPAQTDSGHLIEIAFARFREMAPLYTWLTDLHSGV